MPEGADVVVDDDDDTLAVLELEVSVEVEVVMIRRSKARSRWHSTSSALLALSLGDIVVNTEIRATTTVVEGRSSFMKKKKLVPSAANYCPSTTDMRSPWSGCDVGEG